MLKLIPLFLSLVTTLFFFGYAKAQIKQITQTSLGATGLTFAAEMDQGASTITMTIQGPDDRWFAVGFGASMANGDILAYTDGKVGAMHTLDAWDYRLSAQSAAGVSKDSQQDWTVSSNTTAGGIRTIVATRALNTGDVQDLAINYADASINLVFAKSDNVDFTLAYHGTNRGTTTIPWVELDVTAPGLLATPFDPADNATGVSLGTNLTMSFNENVEPGTGNITLKLSSNDAIVEQFDVASSGAISFIGADVIINPTVNLLSFTDYYVEVDNGAIQDASSNIYSGFNDNSTWNFTTLDNSGDVTAPDLAVGPFDPADNASNVSLTTLMSITFNEDVDLGAGTIELRETIGNSMVESFDVATSGNLSVNADQVTITPSSPLSLGTAYHVIISNNAIIDIAGNPYPGISDSTTWNFTTLATDNIEELNNAKYEISVSNDMLVVRSINKLAFQFEIFLMNGQMLKNGVSKIGLTQIDLSGFNSSSFILRIKDVNGIYSGIYAK